MIDSIRPRRERLDQLLADRAIFGISREEQAEVESLLRQFPDTDADCFDRIAASVLLADVRRCIEPMPISLQARIRTRALSDHAVVHAPTQPPSVARVNLPPTRSRSAWREYVAWAVAAAAIVVALAIGFNDRSPRGKARPLEQLRQQAIRDVKNFARADWQSTGDPAAQSVTGDVVWSTARQQGYMRFQDLKKNDPDQFQYQLWIFDGERDDRYPIDGGVFDIPEDDRDTIVPIRALLQVRRPVMFAVTVEKPGGVVVSSRERICLVANFDG